MPDDQPRPTLGADSDQPGPRIVWRLDASIGPVQLPAGGPQPGTGPAPIGGTGAKTYYIAVSSDAMLPTILDATFKVDATNSQVRLEPVNSVDRLFDDRVGSTGNTTAAGSQQLFPGSGAAQLNLNAVPYTLADVVLYVNTATDLYTVNPFTGQITTFVTSPQTGSEYLGQASPTSNVFYKDIAMRDDGRMYVMTRGSGDNNTATTNGGYLQVDPGDAHPMDIRARRADNF